MMRPSDELACVYLCKQAVDMRKSINGLAALVEGTLALNPFSEHLFIFANRRRNQTTFRIPFGLCHYRVPLASAARKAGTGVPAHRASRQ